eukprot:jgi/Bigna1/138919/aug1.47_g13627
MNEIAARVLIPAISRIMRTHEWRSFAIVDMANARIYNLLKKKIRGIFSANSEVAQTCYPENLAVDLMFIPIGRDKLDAVVSTPFTAATTTTIITTS